METDEIKQEPEEQRDDKDAKNYEPRLNQEWVQVLINLRMKHAKEFTRKRHSATNAWMNIHKEMIDLGAPTHITVEKVKKKWMNLIARYKHLKFVLNSTGSITWPYYDQIDRAYARNPNIIELRKNFNSVYKNVESDSENDSVAAYADSMMKRQHFTTNLIQLRGACKHLFTGKKYAAQRGWMVIKSMHPDGEKYSVEQFSKSWQNLTQRYRSLIETEKDHSQITWVHFPIMHEVMECLEDEVTDVKADNAPLSPTASDDFNDHSAEQSSMKVASNESITNPKASSTKHELFDEEEDNKVSHHINKEVVRTKKVLNDVGEEQTKKDDLLKYLIQRDIQLDKQYAELMKVLHTISSKLDK